MIIDSHHHFWKYDPVQYNWISDEMKLLRRNFLPDDLKSELTGAGVDGVVSVQARQSSVETEWLLQMAKENSFIQGVVGWLPIASPDFIGYLERYSAEKKLVALRHVIQDETDPDFILNIDFNRGIFELKKYNLVYDILIFENQLLNTIKFVDRHPDQVFVLDHIAKPKIISGSISPWRENIYELAKRENVFCKIGGMVTEADVVSWKKEHLLPYFEVCLNAFGSERLMFGSDWPVCLLGVKYSNWLKTVKEFISVLSIPEQNSILSGNAVRAYNLKF